MTDQSKFWIHRRSCHNNAFYNAKADKKFKVRSGNVSYKGKTIYGYADLDIKTRQHHYGSSHSWVESQDGQIIDWVINDMLNRDDTIVWTKKEVEELGFEYKYYTNEKGIINQLKKLFGSGGGRNLFGDWEKKPTEDEFYAEEKRRKLNTRFYKYRVYDTKQTFNEGMFNRESEEWKAFEQTDEYKEFLNTYKDNILSDYEMSLYTWEAYYEREYGSYFKKY